VRTTCAGGSVSGLIGYYVHHQGEGHRQRALSIASCAPQRFVMLGTGLRDRTEGLESIELDDDRTENAGDFASLSPEECLHYAPRNHRGLQNRIATLAQWIARYRPALLVVDVSVEVAMLARLAGVRTIYVRLAGNRDDRAHRQAFLSAHKLLAPFHADLDETSTPAWVRNKTFYAPGITQTLSEVQIDETRILVVSGSGGGVWDVDTLRVAAASLPQSSWRVIGQAQPPGTNPANLEFCGWVADADQQIAAAGIVIGHAGDGIVTSVIAANRPFICLPQARPYDEQGAKARRLAAVGAAVVLERLPQPAEWPELIRRAKTLLPCRQARLHTIGGARTACEWLITTADQAT
jgi:hypothetical protein